MSILNIIWFTLDITYYTYSSYYYLIIFDCLKDKVFIFIKLIVNTYIVLLLRISREKFHAIQFNKRTDHSNRPNEEITITRIKTLFQ